MKSQRRFLTCCLVLLLAACGTNDTPLYDAGTDAEGSDGGHAQLTGLLLRPESLSLNVGEQTSLQVVSVFDESLEFTLYEPVDWQITPETGVVEIDDRSLSAVGAGRASVHASYRGFSSNSLSVEVSDPVFREARGVWVTRWNWTDASDIERVVGQIADAGFNQIYFQVRGNGDAFYDSAVEPWASRLSGSLGGDPGWDPLQVALDAAHAAGLELHAWINTVPAWSCTSADPVSVGIPHVLETHPEWSAVNSSKTPMFGNCTSGYVSLSPAIPGVRAHIRAVAEDLLGAYALDGLHLDYIRYPGPQYSHDDVSETLYAEALNLEPDLSWGDFQRRQIDELVAQVHEGLRQTRPEAVLSAAVWFIRENVWGWSSVSQGYHDYFQDPWAWTAAGTMDVIVPMIYFPLTDPPGERLDFAAMLSDHVDNSPNRFVYAGIEGDYSDFAEIAAEVEASRELGAEGFVIFAYPYIVDHAHWDDYAAGPNAEEALPPIPDWY